MAIAHVNGIDIWYEWSGPALTPSAGAPDPLLVLTHGFAGPSSHGWPPIIEQFKQRFDLLLYDVRAHGRTTVPEDDATVTLPQFAADLAGLLDVLEIERAHIAGVSMGGMISAQFACDYPERLRSLWLCDTLAGNAQGPDEAGVEVERILLDAFERTHRIVEKHGMAGLIQRENRYRRDADQYAHLQRLSLDEQDERNRVAKTEYMTAKGFLAVNRAIRARPDLTSRITSIAAPTQVSCAEWDLFYPCAVRDHALIPNSRLVTIRGSAHSSESFQPERWFQAGRSFIDDVEAGRAVSGEVVLGD